jgi:hypothetical protein
MMCLILPLRSTIFRRGFFLNKASVYFSKIQLIFIIMQKKQSIEFLQKLSPLDAVDTWLNGDFGIGDETALIAAIRKDARIVLSDDSIIDALCDAMDDHLTAQESLERLASAS